MRNWRVSRIIIFSIFLLALLLITVICFFITSDKKSVISIIPFDLIIVFIIYGMIDIKEDQAMERNK